MSAHASKAELTGMVGRALDYDQLDIFSLPPASRRNDPITSKLAGKRAENRCSDGKLSRLHAQVLEAFQINGPMNDETLENLACFQSPRKFAPSTVRKRRSELARCEPPYLVEYGLMTNSNGSTMTIWTLSERARNTPRGGVPVLKAPGDVRVATGETGVGPACAARTVAAAADESARADGAAAVGAREDQEEPE